MPTKSDIRLYPGCTLTVCEASWLFIKIILTSRMRRKEARFSLAGEFSHHRVQIVKNITWDCLLKPDFEVVHITRQILFLDKVHFCCSTSCVSRPFGFYSNRSNASCLQCHFSPLGVNLLLLLLLLVPISQSDILKLTTGAFHPLFFTLLHPSPLCSQCSVLIEGLKERFDILAASKRWEAFDHCLPSRWSAAVAPPDTSMSCSLSSPSLLYAGSGGKVYGTSVYCDVLFVKWAVNSGGIMLRHPVLWQVCFCAISHEGGGEISPHDKPGWWNKAFLSPCYFPLWQSGHVGIFSSCRVRVRAVGGLT